MSDAIAKFTWIAALLLCVAPVLADDSAVHPFGAVECEGRYPKHLQGICLDDGGHIYWCFTVALVKTDADGKLLKQVPVADHHGDLCYHDGRVYVAVNLGKFNRPAGEADSWVYVYDAESLEELARHEVQEVVHGAGGMAYHDGRFLVIGGLPLGIDENYLYEYDESFAFRRRHVLPSGPTLLGIQTAEYAGGYWWFGCYGNPRVLLKADSELQLVGKYEFDCSLGIAGLPDGRFLIGLGSCDRQLGCRGETKVAVADDSLGLRLVDAAEAEEK